MLVYLYLCIWYFFEEVLQEEVDAVITEGTRVSEGPGTFEVDVLDFASRKVSESEGLVVVNFPQRDLDRMMTFHTVAKHTGRKLVLSLKHAYLLEQMNEIGSIYPDVKDDNLAFYAERKGWGLIGREDYPSSMIGQDYRIWEREYLDLDNTVMYSDIKQFYGDRTHLRPGVGRYIMAMTFYATLYKESPVGLPMEPYNDRGTYYPLFHPDFQEITPNMQTLIQRTTWDVVQSHPYSGVEKAN